ncbi:MAG: hypothetical protein JW395_0773 [Nitrospira sp.]|nr:hypothetical protein [Nitrospira sp.]
MATEAPHDQRMTAIAVLIRMVATQHRLMEALHLFAEKRMIHSPKSNPRHLAPNHNFVPKPTPNQRHSSRFVSPRAHQKGLPVWRKALLVELGGREVMGCFVRSVPLSFGFFQYLELIGQREVVPVGQEEIELWGS